MHLATLQKDFGATVTEANGVRRAMTRDRKISFTVAKPGGRERNRAVTIANNAKLDVWIAGSLRPAVVKTKAEHSPGDTSDFEVQLESPMKMTEGERLLLLRNGKLEWWRGSFGDDRARGPKAANSSRTFNDLEAIKHHKDIHTRVSEY